MKMEAIKIEESLTVKEAGEVIRLMQFYGVNTITQLIAEQDKRCNKLAEELQGYRTRFTSEFWHGQPPRIG